MGTYIRKNMGPTRHREQHVERRRGPKGCNTVHGVDGDVVGRTNGRQGRGTYSGATSVCKVVNTLEKSLHAVRVKLFNSPSSVSTNQSARMLPINTCRPDVRA